MRSQRKLFQLFFMAVLLAGVGLVIGGPANAASVKPASSGGYYQIVNKASGQCLDVKQEDGATTPGARVQLWKCTGVTEQQWAPIAQGTGYYTLVNRKSGQCLDIRGGSSTAGTPIQQYPCNGTWAQAWLPSSYISGGPQYGEVLSGLSAQCLDDTGNGTGFAMEWTCQGNDAQLWDFR